MAVTFNNHYQVTLFNDTTINIPKLTVQTLECWVCNALGTPELRRNNDLLLSTDIPDKGGAVIVLSTPSSISVRVLLPSPDYIDGYYRCSVSSGEASVIRLTIGELHGITTNLINISLLDDPFIMREGGQQMAAPLGSIILLYFQLAASSTNGLTNEAFSDPSSLVTYLQSFSPGASVSTSLSQNASGLSFTPYVVGPTSLALYINPVKLINAGIYTVTSSMYKCIIFVTDDKYFVNVTR